ncbi:hypothetical protein ISR92_00800 [Patescibacteria group bacterium]|nr:hypothetical protein [Patescibacteria group bacterium]
MKEIVKIDAVSLAKVIGLITGGIYLLIGIIINLIVLIFGLGSITGLDFLGFGSGIIATVLVSIIVGFIAFIIGLLAGIVYNFIAGYFGGIIVLFEDRTIVEERLREARAAKFALKAEKKRMQDEKKRISMEEKKKKQALKLEKDKDNMNIPTP